MAVRFDLKKFETIKLAYIAYLQTGKCNTDMLQNFAAYKPYLEADEEIRNIQRAIKSQKEAERRRIEEQRRVAKEAAKAAQEAAQAAKPPKKEKKGKRVTESAGNYDWNAPQRRVQRVRVHVSPIAKRLQDVNTFDDLKHLMGTSFIDTVKSDNDFAVLKSTIVRCTENHEGERKEWLKTIEQRKPSLQRETSPTHNINYVNPKAVIIPTPMGGQNKRY